MAVLVFLLCLPGSGWLFQPSAALHQQPSLAVLRYWKDSLFCISCSRLFLSELIHFVRYCRHCRCNGQCDHDTNFLPKIYIHTDLLPALVSTLHCVQLPLKADIFLLMFRASPVAGNCPVHSICLICIPSVCNPCRGLCTPAFRLARGHLLRSCVCLPQS